MYYSVGTECSLPEDNGWGMKLTTHLHLPRFKIVLSSTSSPPTWCTQEQPLPFHCKLSSYWHILTWTVTLWGLKIVMTKGAAETNIVLTKCVNQKQLSRKYTCTTH